VKQCLARDEQLEKATELLCIIEAYPLWKEWKVEVEKQQEALLLFRELETKQGGKVGNGIDLDALKNTVEIVSYLSDKFDGYREWLYKSHIGPMIQEHVNAVLHMICQDRPLHLETEWLDKINTLSWFVRDGASRPVIEKASGFQRFIVGMATRVAFHQIGFCRIQFNQLFIDEGFTSCDSDNLEKVPEFLQGLLKLYNSIYLATHLEELKVCSHTQICIKRDASGLSQIAYGTALEIVEPPKKKGRPLKNKIIVTKESL
jgi:DNA repair exonuclease SbcCD ATPase subunit